MRIKGFLLAAVLAMTPVVAQSQDLQAARTFVTNLYRAYQVAPGPDYVGRQARNVFSPPLLKLMRRDVALTAEGDVGALDGDPICDCQDYEISQVKVLVTRRGNGRAQAVARFRNSGEAQSVTLDLVSVKGRWRVDDVHTANMPSLAGLLRDSIAEAQKRR